MVDNFAKSEPERHPVVSNVGYFSSFLALLGLILLIADTKDWIIALSFWVFAYTLWYARHVYFGQNPPSSELLDLAELTKFRNEMAGEWVAEMQTMQPDFPPRSHPLIHCPSFSEEDTPTGSIFVEGENYKVDCNSRKSRRSLQVFRSRDDRLWFDEFGLEIFELELPTKMKIMDHLGYVFTFRRPEEEDASHDVNPDQTKEKEEIPVYPEEPDVKEGDLQPNSDGKLLTTNDRSDTAV